MLGLVAAMFCGYFALTVYADWNTYEPLNADFEVTASGFVLRRVAPGSVLSRAGLQDGDVLTLVDGHKAEGVLTWTSAIARLTEERPVPVAYERDGIPHEGHLAFNRRSEPLWSSLSGSILIVDRAIQCATLIAAIFIAFRADSVTALLGSWFLATVGAFSTAMPPGIGRGVGGSSHSDRAAAVHSARERVHCRRRPVRVLRVPASAPVAQLAQ